MYRPIKSRGTDLWIIGCHYGDVNDEVAHGDAQGLLRIMRHSQDEGSLHCLQISGHNFLRFAALGEW